MSHSLIINSGTLNDSPVLSERPDLGLRHHVLKGRSLKALAEGLLAIEHIPDINKETMSKLARHAGMETSNKDKVIVNFSNFFFLKVFVL